MVTIYNFSVGATRRLGREHVSEYLPYASPLFFHFCQCFSYTTMTLLNRVKYDVLEELEWVALCRRLPNSVR